MGFLPGPRIPNFVGVLFSARSAKKEGSLYDTQAHQKFQHTWIMLVNVRQHLVPIGRRDGHTEYLSRILAAIRSILAQSAFVFEDLSVPHGGLRPFHQKSTCITQVTLGPYMVTLRPKCRGNAILEARRVAGPSTAESVGHTSLLLAPGWTHYFVPR